MWSRLTGTDSVGLGLSGRMSQPGPFLCNVRSQSHVSIRASGLYRVAGISPSGRAGPFLGLPESVQPFKFKLIRRAALSRVSGRLTVSQPVLGPRPGGPCSQAGPSTITARVRAVHGFQLGDCTTNLFNVAIRDWAARFMPRCRAAAVAQPGQKKGHCRYQSSLVLVPLPVERRPDRDGFKSWLFLRFSSWPAGQVSKWSLFVRGSSA